MIDAIVCLDVIVFGCSGGNYSNVRAFNDNAMIEMTINRRPGWGDGDNNLRRQPPKGEERDTAMTTCWKRQY